MLAVPRTRGSEWHDWKCVLTRAPLAKRQRVGDCAVAVSVLSEPVPVSSVDIVPVPARLENFPSIPPVRRRSASLRKAGSKVRVTVPLGNVEGAPADPGSGAAPAARAITARLRIRPERNGRDVAE